MRPWFALALLIAPVSVGPSAQARQAEPAITISAEDQALVDQAGRRGVLIYAYDQAAWHGTDDALAKAPTLGPKIGGWVVDGTPDATEFLFFDKDSATPHALYVAQFRNNRLVDGRVLSASDDQRISASRLRLISALRSARDAIVTAGVARCSNRPFNTVVLPPETPDGPVLVYFLTAQVCNDAIPMGGHYLVEVAADGSAGAPTPFTNTCLSLPIDRQKPAVSLYTTQIRTPLPTEIHVFTSLTTGIPVLVGTTQNRLLWSVKGPVIAAVSKLENKN